MVAGFPLLLLETHSGWLGVVVHGNPSTGEVGAGRSVSSRSAKAIERDPVSKANRGHSKHRPSGQSLICT